MSSSSIVPNKADSFHEAIAFTGRTTLQGEKPKAAAENDSHQFDFIGSSTIVKDLFSLPYSVDRSVSVAVHNLQGTLILDGGNEPVVSETPKELHQSRGSTTPNQPFHLSNAESDYESGNALVEMSQLQSGNERSKEALSIVQNTLIQTTTSTVEAECQTSPIENHPFPVSSDPREYLSWKFHDMNLLVGSDAMVYRSPGTQPTTVRVEDANDMQHLYETHRRDVESGAFVPDYQLLQRKPSYAEAVRSTPEAEMGARIQPENLVDQVELKNCIIPNPSSSGPVASLVRVTHDVNVDVVEEAGRAETAPVSPVTTVLDTYLDNIMADVPQLALCLREKGFIQSIKLLSTSDIPTHLLRSTTLDTSIPFAICDDQLDAEEQIFSPEIMEMNAQALLRFLKVNCSKDNATYILRREAGCSNVQLFDISNQHQKQWIWRLANLSYRFANRLRHLSLKHPAKSRNFRTRQRSLLQTTLELLETLTDHEGHRHESMVAAVNEALGDTFLVAGSAIETENQEDTSPTRPVSSHLPYAQVSVRLLVQRLHFSSPLIVNFLQVDSLRKAEDHLVYGIKVLRGLLDTQRENLHDSNHQDPTAVEELQPVLQQLLGMSEKLVQVNLRMAL